MRKIRKKSKKPHLRLVFAIPLLLLVFIFVIIFLAKKNDFFPKIFAPHHSNDGLVGTDCSITSSGGIVHGKWFIDGFSLNGQRAEYRCVIDD